MDENVKLSNVKEREITKKNGFAMLFANILGYVATVVTFVLGLVFAINYEDVNDVIFGLGIGLFVVSLALLIVSIVLSCGLKSVILMRQWYLLFLVNIMAQLKVQDFIL